MLTYNTQLRPLVLPEYGRNIQSMVDHCVTIEDREERTRCAYSIIAAMAQLFPELKSGGEYNHKLWDHLMIMSDFQLDIDFPCEVITKENLFTLPDKVEYSAGNLRLRHYGSNIQRMIERACEMPEGEERNELVVLIAYQMKKLMLGFNREGADDAKVFNDLAMMSQGQLRLSTDELKLREIIEPAKPTGKKKKKK